MKNFFKRWFNLGGTMTAWLVTMGYMAEHCEVYAMDDIIALPVVNAIKWIWRRDIKPLLRRISK